MLVCIEAGAQAARAMPLGAGRACLPPGAAKLDRARPGERATDWARRPSLEFRLYGDAILGRLGGAAIRVARDRHGESP